MSFVFRFSRTNQQCVRDSLLITLYDISIVSQLIHTFKTFMSAKKINSARVFLVTGYIRRDYDRYIFLKIVKNSDYVLPFPLRSENCLFLYPLILLRH